MFRLTFCIFILTSPAFSLATVNWLGGSNSNWHDSTNWSGGIVPGPNDEVVVLNSNSGSVVNLSAPVDVNSLLIGGGIQVNNNGYPLVVDDGATSTLLNGNAVLNITHGSGPWDYATSHIGLTSGSSVSLLNADARVSDPGSVFNNGTTFAGFGDVIFPGVLSGPQTWLTNSGTIRPLLGELIIASIDFLTATSTWMGPVPVGFSTWTTMGSYSRVEFGSRSPGRLSRSLEPFSLDKMTRPASPTSSSWESPVVWERR